MAHTLPPDLERDLQAYVDGFLEDDPERRRLVEEKIAASPEAADVVRVWREQNEALRQAYDPWILEPVPARLRAVLDKPSSSSAVRNRIAAALALIMVAGAAGWTVGHFGRTDQWLADGLVDQAYDHYTGVSGATGGAAHRDAALPMNWLSERLSLTFRAPDLSAQGYGLVESGTVMLGDSRAVRLKYAQRDGGGGGFSLFLRPRWAEGESGLRILREGDVSLAAWLDGPLAATIASRVPPERFGELAAAVRRAMRRPESGAPTLEPRGPQRQEAVLSNGLPSPGVHDQQPLIPGIGPERRAVVPRN